VTTRTGNKINDRSGEILIRENEDTFTWAQLCYVADTLGVWPKEENPKTAALKFRKMLLDTRRFENV
jgi:hypothetical protein